MVTSSAAVKWSQRAKLLTQSTAHFGARSLDGVKRRTRAGMGRCQAGFCSPRTMEILEREVPMSMFDITKNGVGSNIVVGYNKEV